MKKTLIISILLISSLLSCSTMAAPTPHAMPAAVVSTATAKQTTFQPIITAIATLTAAQGVDVTTEMPGIVDSIHFDSGQTVKKGQVLVILRNNDLKAAVQSDQADVASAQRNDERYEALAKKGLYTAQSQMLDTAETTLAKDKASLAKDTADLNKTIITAPFSGRLGIRQINVGQFISAGQSIVSLQQTKPIYADFNVPQNNLQGVNVGNKINLTTSLYPKQIFTGKVTALGSALDANTRTLAVRAELPNEEDKLIPGMYSNINLLLPADGKVIVVPQSAISYNAYGDFVYVVKNNKVRTQFVTVSQQYANNAVISKGLNAGDVVVIAGQNKLHEGSAVTINNNPEK